MMMSYFKLTPSFETTGRFLENCMQAMIVPPWYR